MTPKTPKPAPARPESSRDLPGRDTRTDTARDTREAMIEDAAETDVAGRDLVHGEGGTIDLPTKPDDLNHDD